MQQCVGRGNRARAVSFGQQFVVRTSNPIVYARPCTAASVHGTIDEHHGQHIFWPIVDYPCVSDCEAHLRARAFIGLVYAVVHWVDERFGLACIVEGCLGGWMCVCEAECHLAYEANELVR